MRCRAIGPRAYFKRELLSVTKFALGFGLFFFLIAIGNQQIWHARGPQVVLAGVAFGIFYRLFIEAMPAFVTLNQTYLHYKGRRTRSFHLAACESFRVTPARGLLRFEFDGPRRRSIGLEHVVIAAPQSALLYLATLATTDPATPPAEPETSPIAQLNYQPKQINPYGGAFFGMGFPCVFLGIAMLVFPIVKYLFFGLAHKRLLLALAVSLPAGLLFVAIGSYCIHIGLPWMRQKIEHNQRIKRIK